jgi:hypothetical protein
MFIHIMTDILKVLIERNCLKQLEKYNTLPIVEQWFTTTDVLLECIKDQKLIKFFEILKEKAVHPKKDKQKWIMM